MRRISLVAAAAAVALTVAIPAGTAAGSADTESDRATPAGRMQRVERLRLRCGVRGPDDVSDVARVAVRCEWSEPTSTRAAGVRLLRLDPRVDDHRQIIFRTGELGVTTFTDTDVRRGHRYAYAVQALSRTGRVVGQSRTVWVSVPSAPEVEVLRLACRLGPAGEAIGCEWSRPRSVDAAVVTLWRSVDGGPREIVERFRPTGPTAYRDPVPAGAARVTYAVIATTDTDRIVARSRPETVALRDRVTDRVRDGVADPVTDRPSDRREVART